MTEEQASVETPDLADAEDRLAQAMATPLEILKGAAPQHKGADPLYNLPWYLFLGPSTAAIREVLQAGTSDAVSDTAEVADVWQWWRLRNLTAIAWPASLLCSRVDRDRWQLVERAMALLVDARKHQPVNGIVVVVTIDELTGPRPEVERLAGRIRDIVNELHTTLKLRFPTTVVVTGLNRLAGHDAFFSALDGTAGQVLGLRRDFEDESGDVAAFMAETFDECRDRLHGIRMSLLRRPGTSEQAGQIFRFVTEFDRLREPLLSFVETLFAESRGDKRRPLWRALYLAAPGSAAPHLADLFDRFLPVDASLARRL